ncbi:hypothetical protein [Flavobacterium sp.]|uniref:hypothetical protein n=1 Tax=Flavobacterium sp. TaxID=239 RepID=UPI00120C15C3|nr:hypothetical protein [Flavobacterium sp.]RZJ71801.1 MAG: hypothetical protein EOO49_09045 [Flavobacterium sp.]
MTRLAVYAVVGLFFGICSCHKSDTKSEQKIEKRTVASDTIKYHKIRKLSITGDFDGDGKQDVLSEHFYSNVQKREISQTADPFQVEWETVIKWFYDQDVQHYIALDNPAKTELRLGNTHGLLCLINIGDENRDGKDEIALVPDLLDHTRSNTCTIYSLCDGKWQTLKQFDIYEGAFDFQGVQPVFNSVPDYLEKQNGRWVFHDYHADYDSAQDVGKLLPLKLGKCK